MVSLSSRHYYHGFEVLYFRTWAENIKGLDSMANPSQLCSVSDLTAGCMDGYSGLSFSAASANLSEHSRFVKRTNIFSSCCDEIISIVGAEHGGSGTVQSQQSHD